MNTVLPSLPAKSRTAPIQQGSEFYEGLAAHAHIVAFVLRAARSVARVAIVTNSMSPWVLASGQRYLPGIRIEALLKELQIPVYYARRHVPDIPVKLSQEQQSIEIDRTTGARVGLNIVAGVEDSIEIVEIEDNGLVGVWNRVHPKQRVMPGDRIVAVNGKREELAQECRKKQVLAAVQRPSTRHLCKTVNLLVQPSVEQLGAELRILMVWLSRMVKHEHDFDASMEELHELEQMFQSASVG